jgi:hypothetical protein
MSQPAEIPPDPGFPMAESSKGTDTEDKTEESTVKSDTIECPFQNKPPSNAPIYSELQVSVKKGMFSAKF